jgi:hypothetical protein
LARDAGTRDQIKKYKTSGAIATHHFGNPVNAASMIAATRSSVLNKCP